MVNKKDAKEDTQVFNFTADQLAMLISGVEILQPDDEEGQDLRWRLEEHLREAYNKMENTK